VDAAVAAARFQDSLRRVRHLCTERRQGKQGARDGTTVALVTRELRRLSSRPGFDAGDPV
jgi:hypothetical protein